MDNIVATSSYQDATPIDTFELLMRLWVRKYIIVAFILAAVVLAGLYTLTLKQRWTSIAFVSEPRVAHVKAYLERRRAVARVDGNKPVDSQAVIKALFERFIALSVSARHKRGYIERTTYYKGLQANASDTLSGRVMLAQLERDALRIEFVSKNQIFPYYRFSFAGDSPEMAQTVLRGYIDHINAESFRLVDQEFNDTLDASVLALQMELVNIDFNLRRERDNRIANLEEAVGTARKAGLKNYTVGQKLDGNTVIELNDSKRLFMLGEKYLLAELSTAREAPIIFPTRYYEVQRELKLLTSLRAYDVKAWSYNYQLEPTLPTKADGLNRPFILMLAGVVGGVTGCVYILLVASLRSRKLDQYSKPLPRRVS